MCCKINSEVIDQITVTHTLGENEIKDPFLVIRRLFSVGDLQEFKELLWLSFKTTITGNFPKNLSLSERNQIALFYEQMEKLLEAAYLLNEQEKSNLYPGA